MGKKLIIVESPAKIKTLKKFLGKDFVFESSVGHIRDLPKKDFGIDFEHNYEPTYENLPDKKEVIQKLKKAAKDAEIIYLAPDPDREGEAIAWHILSVLPKSANATRITFHSITKNEVLNALQHPRELDMALINAQQARRLLDRMVGYSISPILTRKLKRGKGGISAGRVQSVALKLVVDREKEIDAFKSIEYWNIKAIFADKKPFEAQLYSYQGKRLEKETEAGKASFAIPNEKEANKLSAILKTATCKVAKVEAKEKSRNPVPPFITSSLQQEASRHYGYSASRTMNIAQGLYEGIDMGPEDFEGVITYMRTDSVQVATEAQVAARDFILKTYGKDYLPEKPRVYTSKKSAQEAHEAIRPTNLNHPPEKIRKYLTPDQFKLYDLIWKRFVASQMTSAIYDTISAEIETDKDMILRATGSTIKFRGFLAVYEEKNDEDIKETDHILPSLKVNMPLSLKEVIPQQSFTKPPARFTEASLVKELEKSGIGRPSTYATIMNKIQSREYTTKENKALVPTELGKIIAQMLDENFQAVVNVNFTAQMEDQLELIAEGKKNWVKILDEFWTAYLPMVKKAEKEALVPKIETDLKCPKCGKPLQKIWSKSKYFYGCSNYPECDYTIPIEALNFKKEDYDESFEWEQKCPKCKSDMNLRFGKFGPFLGCTNYPKCHGIVNIPKKGEKGLPPEERPNCPALGCDGKIMMRRSRFGKIFYSCSNYPDCDIIVNELAELETKYDAHHPKTAYIKAKGKKVGGRGGKRVFPLSPELAAITGEKELSRGDIVKKTWEYIKKHNLQDPNNKRRIVPDEKMAKVFGSKESIDMMQLSGILGRNLKKG